jgi:hypothetical protein
MAVAFSRGDQLGDRYRDLLELCLGDQPPTVGNVLAIARQLFPDVPVSDYGTDEMDVEDAVTLARLAAQRDGRVLPVLVYDQQFRPEGALMHLQAVVLARFHPEDSSKRTFWDAEPPHVGGWRMGSRVEFVPPGFQCLVFGWLPPADHCGGKNAK